MKTNLRSTTLGQRLNTNVRIIWAIAWKDIVEAIRNKNTLAVLFTAIPMIFVYYYLPVLSARNEPPLVRVYDAGDSLLVARLENSDVLEVRTYPIAERMKEALTHSDIPELALTIPEGFDRALEAGAALELQGYVLNWVDQAQAADLRRLVEEEIAFQLGRPVPIILQERVYLQPDSHGIGTSAGIALIFVVTMVGLTLIPHLMLEEKSSRTIDVLMLSPAGSMGLVAGKAIAGLFYCMLGATVALVVYRWLVLHWWLAVLATVLGALFTISLGLLLGSIIESRAQLTMWAWVFILPIFLPVFLSLMEGLVPDGAIRIMRLFPTVVVMQLLRASFAFAVSPGPILLQLAWMAAWVAGGLVLVAWLVNRRDRQPARAPDATRVAEPGTAPLLDAAHRWWASFSERFSSLQPQPATKHESMDSASIMGAQAAQGRPGSWQMIWAIASKDITATLKNKLALSIMLGSAFIVLSNAVPRLLLQARENPAVVVYDQGRSTLIRALGASEDVRMGVVDSEEEMREAVSSSQELLLGLVVPADFDRLAGSRAMIELDGYAVHWAEPEKISQRVAFFEEQLGSAAWGTVRINVSEQRLYPSAELSGQTLMFVLLATIVLLTMGLALAPLLFVEERQAHTLEVLMVSPARITEVVGGKALAGAFYCLLAALVIFLLNRALVVHWAVALLAVVLGAAFAVTVGLLVGMASDNPTTVSLWGTMLLLVFFGLTLLNALPGLDWPPIFRTLVAYLPTVALAELFGIALAGEFSPVQLWANAAALLTAALIAVGLLGWRLRLADR
jgi:ABC-2 type transport system permease protein